MEHKLIENSLELRQEFLENPRELKQELLENSREIKLELLERVKTPEVQMSSSNAAFPSPRIDLLSSSEFPAPRTSSGILPKI